MTALTRSRSRPPRLEARAWLREIARPGPERWIWGLVVLGWLQLSTPLWHPASGMTGDGHHAAGMDMGTLALSSSSAFLDHLAMWIGMILATMLPLVALNLRKVALRSPPTRARAATVDVAVGWFGPWLAAGAAVTLAVVVLGGVPQSLLVTAATLLAISWESTRRKRVSVARCHRTYAPPLGAAARAACARFGTSLGRDCVVSCGWRMVLMTVAGHRMSVVVAIAWLSWRDRRRPHDRPGSALSVAVLIGCGLVALVLPGSAW